MAGLLAAVISCSTSAGPEQEASVEPSRPEQTGDLGSTLTISARIMNGYGKILAGTADFSVASPRTIGEGNRQLPGTTAVSFDVMVIGKEGTVLVNPFFFAAHTDDGATLLTDTSLSGNGLGVKELTKGQERSGHIFFNMPTGAEIKDVIFTEGLTGATLGKWTTVGPLPQPPSSQER